MTDFAPTESLLSSARTRAARGEWGEMRQLVGATPAEGRGPELTLLLAEAHLRTGQLAEAHALIEPVVRLCAEAGNTWLHRRAVNMLGAAAFELGHMKESEQQFNEALALANLAGDSLTLGRATNNLGMICHIRGQYDRALTQYQLAVPAYQRLGYTAGLAETHHNMALALRELEQLDLADRNERRAIDYARGAGNRRLLAIAHVGRAELLLRRGRAVVAVAGARLGAEEYAAIGDVVGEADAWRVTGAAHLMQGEMIAAAQALDRAVDLARQHGSALIEAEAHESRARLHARMFNWPLVSADVADARRLYQSIGAKSLDEALFKWCMSVLPAEQH